MTNYEHVYPSNGTLKTVISYVSPSRGLKDTMINIQLAGFKLFRQDRTAAGKTRGGGLFICLLLHEI